MSDKSLKDVKMLATLVDLLLNIAFVLKGQCHRFLCYFEWPKTLFE